MTVADISRKLPARITLPTLGGESSFHVVNERGVVIIINSSGTQHKLNDAHVLSVYNRYTVLAAGRRLMASEYVDPNWPERPNRIFSPYLARVLDYIR